MSGPSCRRRQFSRSATACRQRRSAAFTLVELLVVIGIIAVLIGILLPALGRARASASSLACQANLRELGGALQIYAVGNKGSLPPGFYEIPPIPPGSITVVRWTDLLMGTLASKYGQNSTDAFFTNSSAARLRKIFICPDAPNEDMLSGRVFACTYLSHPRLMPQIAAPGSAAALQFPWLAYEPYYLNQGGRQVVKSPYKFSRIKNAAEIAVLWDAALQFDTTLAAYVIGDGLPVANQIDNNRYYVGGSPNLTDTFTPGSLKRDDPIELIQGFQGKDTNKDNGSNYQRIRFRHIKDTIANALMADGHVEAFRYNPRTKTSSLLRKNIYVNLQQ
jgi:prepilin-type processing-associated H-X9-DG protein